jgi:uncharacterized phage-associated protein
MHDPRIIANAVLTRAERVGRLLTNLDIQKLVYLLHGRFLTTAGRPLVTGEFSAWQYGPVHPVLYDAFKAHQEGPIDRPALRYDPVRRQFAPMALLADPEVEDLLDSTLPDLLGIPTYALVQITHAEGTPWSKTMAAAVERANVGMVISNALIASHFEGDGVGRELKKRFGVRRSVWIEAARA